MKNGIIVLAFLFLCACEPGKKNIDLLLASSLREQIRVNDELVTNHEYKLMRYRSRYFDVDTLLRIHDSLMAIYKRIPSALGLRYPMRPTLWRNYRSQVAVMEEYCAWIRSHKRLFLPEDLENIRFISADSSSVASLGSDTTAGLFLTADLKSQLGKLLNSCTPAQSIAAIIENRFHDFFIVEASTADGSTCRIDIKNNYLSRTHERSDYKVRFKSLKRIEAGDTGIVNNRIALTRLSDRYRSNTFRLDKGHYQFATELVYLMPDGEMKFGETTFEFDMN